MVIRCNSVVFELITINYVAKQQITMNYGPPGPNYYELQRSELRRSRMTMNYGAKHQTTMN
jgi:hypothetical protein